MNNVFKSTVAAVVLALGSMSVQAQEVVWKVPTSVPEGSPFYVNFLERFANNANVLTNGRVEIQPFGAGVIVPALEVYDAVLDGVVEAGHSTPSYLVNQDPTNAIFAGFPGGMGPNTHMSWIYEGGGKELLENLRAEQGLKTLIVGIGSTEILAHSNKSIKNAEDLKGMKYRTSGAWAEVMRDYFGAVPTVVPPGETYTLLQRKGVDAVEWATPSSNKPEGFHQAAKYIVVPGVHQPTFMWEVVVQQKTWDALSDDLKVLLEQAAKLTTFESLINFYDADMKAMHEYKEGRNVVITLSPDFVDEMSDAGYDWAIKQAKAQEDKGSSNMMDVLENYKKYHDRWKEQSDYLIKD